MRVINATDDFTFVQWDPEYIFGEHPPPAPPPPSPIKPATIMPGVNIVGTDDPAPCPAAIYGNIPENCEAVCKAKQFAVTSENTSWADSKPCLGWTLHYNSPADSRAPGWRCCTKTTLKGYQYAANTTTSGIIHPSQDVFINGKIESHIRTNFVGSGGGCVTFSEFYNLRSDPWQMHNLWSTLTDAKKAALESEIRHRFACTGTRSSPSTCE